MVFILACVAVILQLCTAVMSWRISRTHSHWRIWFGASLLTAALFLMGAMAIPLGHQPTGMETWRSGVLPVLIALGKLHGTSVHYSVVMENQKEA